MSPASPGIWSVFAAIRSGITDPVDVRGVKSPVAPKSRGDSALKSPVTPESAIGWRLQVDGRLGINRRPQSTSFGAGERPLSPRSVGITSVMIGHSAIRGRSTVTSDEMVGAGPGGLPCRGMSSSRSGRGARTIDGDHQVRVGSYTGQVGLRVECVAPRTLDGGPGHEVRSPADGPPGAVPPGGAARHRRRKRDRDNRLAPRPSSCPARRKRSIRPVTACS